VICHGSSMPSQKERQRRRRQATKSGGNALRSDAKEAAAGVPGGSVLEIFKASDLGDGLLDEGDFCELLASVGLPPAEVSALLQTSGASVGGQVAYADLIGWLFAQGGNLIPNESDRAAMAEQPTPICEPKPEPAAEAGGTSPAMVKGGYSLGRGEDEPSVAVALRGDLARCDADEWGALMEEVGEVGHTAVNPVWGLGGCQQWTLEVASTADEEAGIADVVPDEEALSDDDEDLVDDASSADLLKPPDGSASWDWPLSRSEKKTRVGALEKHLELMDKELLLQELMELREFRRCHDESLKQKDNAITV